MKKVLNKEGRAVGNAVVFITCLLMLSTGAIADEGMATGGEKGGFFTGVKKGLSNLTSGFPNIFSELSPADVGHKPRVRPHFSFNQGFNSNARVGSTQVDAAWQARIAPGITVSIPSGKLYTEVDYTYGFATSQGRKSIFNVGTHNLNALARYDVSVDTIVGVGNNLQLSEVPGQADRTFVLETATAQVSHRLAPKLNASLSDVFQWYDDQTRTTTFVGNGTPGSRRNKEFNNEFVDNGVGLNLGYDATSDLTAGPSFNWNVRHYDTANGKSYWQIQPALNASYRLGPKTTVMGNVGWAYRKFSDKTTSTVDSRESELVYGAGVTHLYGRKLAWSVNYAKTLQDTFNTNFIFRDRPEATLLDDIDSQFRVVKSHRLGTNATFNVNEKNSVGAFADVSITTGDPDDNIIVHQKSQEKTMQIGASYTYRFNRYIAFDLQYAFGRRFSADNSAPVGARTEYTFHKVTGGVNISI